MNIKNFPRWITFLILAMLVIIACNLATSPPASIPITGENTATEAGPTAAQATSTPVIIIKEVTVTSPPSSPTPKPTSGPSCTVLQDLNLRFGPGTAFRPPITALKANDVVTPLGFIPEGIPGGIWVYIEESATLRRGWVSAGSDYVSCNIDVSTLPAVAYGTPPPFFPTTAQASPGTGNGFCVDPDSGFECIGFFSDAALFQFQLFRNGRELSQDDGVEPISFTVTRNDNQVYRHVENNFPYCIFGDSGGACNSWVYEDGVYKWEAGGDPVKSGRYKVGVDVTVDGDDSHWEAEFRVDVP
jgi:hypothetical protein